MAQKDYVHQEYPKWIAVAGKPQLVNSYGEEKQLLEVEPPPAPKVNALIDKAAVTKLK